ncbi:uncharacterized protein LOC130813128 isoform X3 [Amaranthus tricolor]|uniref:uncharacterized protein LOC130813128 isoform X3 n=1 Tax=Amaranthus tricolor TaxID=29722 RepID=UPI0025877549|nr:uncharacterized protein LOC130813128 isoform X3 [Amaranthus tricolor]XP_057534847.1 uncharacterized protein LOC130813128 isoform X3 [Amaranthus tricolor]
MSILPLGNLISKLFFIRQPLLVPFPWMKRSIVICFSSKADGSDLPARYIPKKQRDVNQNQCSSLGDSVLQVGIQTRSTSSNDELGHKTLDRIKRPRGCKIDDEEFLVNIDDANGVDKSRKHGRITMETNCLNALLDVGECLNVPEEMAQELQTVKMVSRGTRHELKQENRSRDGVADTESMEALAKEVELMQHHNGNDIGNQERSNNCRTKRGVEKVAIELLAKRAFTGAELRKKLAAKNFPVDDVEAVLHDFRNRGLVNDYRYAEMFSLSKWESSSWGPRRIKQDKYTLYISHLLCFLMILVDFHTP